MCFKYSALLCATEKGRVTGGVGKKRDMACCKKAGEGSRRRSDEAEDDRRVALLSVGLSSRGGTDGWMGEEGAQRSNGLEKVGVSDWGGYTNKHTDT